MKRKPIILAVLYGVLLSAFTVYVLLDTFTISRVYVKVPQSTAPSATLAPLEPEATEPVRITENSYDDGSISIAITEYREYDTTIYVADVRLSSPDYLKTALAQDSYGQNIKEKTSEMAENHGALLAVNGDYYGSREKGYVLRNGVLYREKGSGSREDLVIWSDGSFEVVQEKEVSAQKLLEGGARQVLSFGPALVLNSQICVDENTEVGQATYSNPRTAIAMVDELHYLLVVSDGRTDRSEGLSLYELAGFLQSLGAQTAYNLDGGGSSTMWFNGQIINEPVNHGSEVSERSVSDIVYIGY